MCMLNNGGCSHLCVWNVLGGNSECSCPQNYRLLDDGKTCFPTSESKYYHSLIDLSKIGKNLC